MNTRTVSVHNKLMTLSVINDILLAYSSMIHESHIFDLGAAEGRFAIYASLCKIKTYAFEPEPLNFEVLVENINLNSLNEICIPINIGVNDQTQISEMIIGQPCPGGHLKIITKDNHRSGLINCFAAKQTINVRTCALDEWCQTNNTYPTKIKVDIDGLEKNFFLGFRNTMSKSPPKEIMIELKDMDEDCKYIKIYLDSLGYKIKEKHLLSPDLFNYLFIKEN